MARLVTLGVTLVVMLCLFKPALSCCCFVPREPCVYQTCGCSETPAGVVSCGCPSYITSTTGFCTCDSCFRDAARPCNTCTKKTSPVCSCLKSLDSCGCGSCGCSCDGLRIYFPEVEYPNNILEMNPFYYANFFSF